MDRQFPGHFSSEAQSKGFTLLAVSRPMLLNYFEYGLYHASGTEEGSSPAALAE